MFGHTISVKQMQIEKIAFEQKTIEIYGLEKQQSVRISPRWAGTIEKTVKKDIWRNIFMKLQWNVLQAIYSVTIKMFL